MKIESLYVCPTFNCNLKCPHCELRKLNIVYNHDKFLYMLKTLSFGHAILFGGEPFLYDDRYTEIIESGLISSVSTNLLTMKDSIGRLIHEYNISVATSWNVSRFTHRQYHQWLNNVQYMRAYTEQILVLVTLTEDLILSDKNVILNMFKRWKNYGVTSIMFEQLCDESKNQEFYNRCDTWLCDIDYMWDSEKMPINKIVEKIKHGWTFDCTKTYTLLPDGTLIKGCPQTITIPYSINMRCVTCEKANICQPCALQANNCTMPINLYNRYNG